MTDNLEIGRYDLASAGSRSAFKGCQSSTRLRKREAESPESSRLRRDLEDFNAPGVTLRLLPEP